MDEVVKIGAAGTSMFVHQTSDTPDISVKIRECFARPWGSRATGVVLDDRDTSTVRNLDYLLRLVRSAPHELTHGKEHKKLREAVRTLLEVLPTMITAAEKAAAEAAADGRTSEMTHFAWRCQALLDAAQPFATVAGGRRNHLGWWHGWARVIAGEVRRVLHKHGGLSLGIRKPNSPVVVITHRLLGLVPIKVKGEDMGIAAVLNALEEHD